MIWSKGAYEKLVSSATLIATAVTSEIWNYNLEALVTISVQSKSTHLLPTEMKTV